VVECGRSAASVDAQLEPAERGGGATTRGSGRRRRSVFSSGLKILHVAGLVRARKTTPVAAEEYDRM
jgi:hypothetical protein